MSQAVRRSRSLSLASLPYLVASLSLALSGATGCTPTAPGGKADGAKPEGKDKDAPPAKDSGGDAVEQKSQAEPQAGVELHEWGLVGTAIADPLARVHLAGGPRARAGAVPILHDVSSMAVGKPVIYAHLKGDAPIAMSVTVRVPKSDILEIWPATALDKSENEVVARWNVTVTKNENCVRAPWPTAQDPACGTVSDQYCELAEIESYATEDGACIVQGDAGHDLLFYRASSSSQQLAVMAQRDDKGVVTVRAREGSKAPAQILWVRRTAESVTATVHPLGAQGVVLDAAATPAAGEAVADPAAWLSEKLLAGGLTADEKTAFMRAWEMALLAPLTTPAAGQMPPVGLAPSADAILYLLEPDEIEGLVSLESEPKAMATKRVFVGHVDLSPPVTR